MLSGRQLKIKRILHNIEAKEIAEYLGVSKTYISLMENEKRKIPTNLYKRWVKYLK